MPRKSAIKCYFRCATKGPFHHFPKPEYPNLEKFIQWKNILNEDMKQNEHSYIYNNVRICDRHFEQFYRSSSKRLTQNAVPTLYLTSTFETVHSSHSVETEKCVDTQKEDNDASCSHHLDLNMNQVQLQRSFPNSSKLFPKVKTRTQNCSKELRLLKARLLKLKEKCKTQKKLILQAKRLSQNKAFLKAIENLPEPIRIFTNLQLKKSSILPRGRRFTTQEKILCLTIYKQSQKAYNILQKLFYLPSKRTMQKVLSCISLTAGVNDIIIEHIKKAVIKLSNEKKLCTLIFDEVALSPGLFFQTKMDDIIGFEDFGSHKTNKLADHALVFMLKGLKSKYKQPISFTFCQSATKSVDLKVIIKNVITQIQSTGLIVVSTICDQSPTNISGINNLVYETKQRYFHEGTEWKSLGFEINGKKIIPIFDPSHLLKGLRNNLLTKNLRFQQNEEIKIAKWSHLHMLLEVDVGESDIRLLNKLTETHIYKDKLPKMKVKYAAQVFSQRVSATMRFLANHNILPKECVATADLLLLVDKLFDSFNGHSYQEDAKLYRTALKTNSPHFKLWDETLPVLNSMRFEANKNGIKKFIEVPSIKNWIRNIHATRELFFELNKYHGVSSLLTRNLNQDPLENFFCNIRSNGIRNVSPTCSQFVGAYKTLLVHNLTSSHSIGANCEHDNNKILKPLRCLINSQLTVKDTLNEKINVDSLLNLLQENVILKPRNIISIEAKRYVAGYLVHKCIKNVCKNCKICKMQLLSTTPPANDNYILFRDYTKKSCKYPSEVLCSFLDDICAVIQTQLGEEPQTKNIKEKIIQKADLYCDFSFLSCETHKNLKGVLLKYVIHLIIHSWCTNVNRLLTGKFTNNPNNEDNVKIQAIKYYNTHKKKKINI